MENIDSKNSWKLLAAACLSQYISSLPLSTSIFHYIFITHFDQSKELSSKSMLRINISCISSLALGSMYFGCFIADYLSSKFFSCKTCLLIGTFLSFLGLFSSSFRPNLISLLFLYGFLFGLGSGFQFIASQKASKYYFNKLSKLALSLQSISYALGTITFPFLIEYLIYKFGWQGSLIILSGLPLQGCWLSFFYKLPTIKQLEAFTKLKEEEIERKQLEKEWSQPLRRRLLKKTENILMQTKSIVAFIETNNNNNNNNDDSNSACSRESSEVIILDAITKRPESTWSEKESSSSRETTDDEEVWLKMSDVNVQTETVRPPPNNGNNLSYKKPYQRQVTIPDFPTKSINLWRLTPYVISILLSSSVWSFVTVFNCQIIIEYSHFSKSIAYGSLSILGITRLFSTTIMTNANSIKPLISHVMMSVMTSASSLLAPSLLSNGQTINSLHLAIMLIGVSINAPLALISKAVVEIMKKKYTTISINLCILTWATGCLLGPVFGAFIIKATNYETSLYMCAALSICSSFSIFVLFFLNRNK